jgi:hypothetical protein
MVDANPDNEQPRDSEEAPAPFDVTVRPWNVIMQAP